MPVICPVQLQRFVIKYRGIMKVLTTISGILMGWGGTLPPAPCDFNISKFNLEEENIKIDKICADAINRIDRTPISFLQSVREDLKSLFSLRSNDEVKTSSHWIPKGYRHLIYWS